MIGPSRSVIESPVGARNSPCQQEARRAGPLIKSDKTAMQVGCDLRYDHLDGHTERGMRKVRSNRWRLDVLPGSARSIAVGLGCVLLLATAAADAAGTRDSARPRDRPQSTKIQYEPPASAQSRDILKALREGRVLESFAAELDGMLRLPRALTLRTRECEEPNAYYNPDNSSIELCYNLLPAIAEDLATAGIAGERLEEAVTHVFSFSLLHELGHALIDILDLAVPGRQEDVGPISCRFMPWSRTATRTASWRHWTAPHGSVSEATGPMLRRHSGTPIRSMRSVTTTSTAGCTGVIRKRSLMFLRTPGCRSADLSSAPVTTRT